jgi:DnaJ-class molecular chaperone
LGGIMNLNEVIKKAAVEAVKAGDPSDIVYGTVVSANPVSIQIDQKLTLTKEFITLTNNVKDYEVEVSINDGSKQKMKVFKGLKKGDSVIMIKSQGGQKYVVIDKII